MVVRERELIGCWLVGGVELKSSLKNLGLWSAEERTYVCLFVRVSDLYHDISCLLSSFFFLLSTTLMLVHAGLSCTLLNFRRGS